MCPGRGAARSACEVVRCRPGTATEGPPLEWSRISGAALRAAPRPGHAERLSGDARVPDLLHICIERGRIAQQLGVGADGALVGVDVLGAAFDSCQDPRGDLHGGRLYPAHAGGHVGVDVAGIDAGHQRTLPAQLEADAAGQRPCRRFRRAIGSLHRHVEPAHHREHVDDRAAAVVREHRRKRAAHRQSAEVVDLHLGSGGCQARRRDQRLEGGEPGIVDENGHVRARGGGRRDLPRVSNVEANRNGSTFRKLRDVPCRGIDLAAAGLDQGARQCRTQPAIGARHEGDLSFDPHGPSAVPGVQHDIPRIADLYPAHVLAQRLQRHRRPVWEEQRCQKTPRAARWCAH